jgi:chromatin segregation and condensation protein Rec8/ScpA/Scc1 (kleisin family)
MAASTADAEAPLAEGSEHAGEPAASELPAPPAAAMSAPGQGAAEERTPLLTLDGFTGPLERLLTLARAHQVDLTQLSLAILVDQLAAALRKAPPTTPLGEKGDWLVMAAWLVQLRSVLLLPPEAPARQDAIVAADQLRARLLALQTTQALAAWLRQRPQLGRDTFARGRPELLGVASETATLDVTEFLWSSLALFDDDTPDADTVPVYQPRRFALHTIAAARERIRLRLAADPEGGSLDRFLPDPAAIAADGAPQVLQRRSAWSSTFVASLELARHGDVALAQQAFLAPVHLSTAQHANRHPMSKMQTAPPAGFTPAERDYIRRELDMFFSTLPSVAEGFQLKTWRGGPQAGQPKLSPNAKGLLERGLMRLDTSQRLPRLFFTDAGLAELRRMMADRRFADPKKFAHVRQELGLDPGPEMPPDVGSGPDSDG